MLYTIFRSRTGLAIISEGWCPNCGWFWKNFSVWQSEFTTSTTLPIIPGAPWRLCVVRRPWHLPGWPTCLVRPFPVQNDLKQRSPVIMSCHVSWLCSMPVALSKKMQLNGTHRPLTCFAALDLVGESAPDRDASCTSWRFSRRWNSGESYAPSFGKCHCPRTACTWTWMQ